MSFVSEKFKARAAPVEEEAKALLERACPAFAVDCQCQLCAPTVSSAAYSRSPICHMSFGKFFVV